MCVKIVGMLRKTNLKTNEPYTVLVLQGNAIVLQSKATSRSYVSARKTTIACALDDVLAKSLIGQTLPGSIEKVACTPFEVKLPTGKKVKISEKFQYFPDPEKVETVIG
jgi:hypothetical protein